MYRLRTFGRLALERDGVPVDAIGAHRKALALLAVVAVQGSVGRERLMALLWPESAAERARGSLKQTVHLLRRSLGDPDALLGTAELRLNPDRIASDVQLFLRALGEGRPGEAVEFYAGPFLDGVHLNGAPEFERWVDEKRAELASRHGEALEELARGSASREDHTGAVAWWRRLQGADPLSGRVALELMLALQRAGDAAGALRHARVHEILLREELGIAPDPAIRELVARLSAARSPAAPPPGGRPHAGPASVKPLDAGQKAGAEPEESPRDAAEGGEAVAVAKPVPRRGSLQALHPAFPGGRVLLPLLAAGLLLFFLLGPWSPVLPRSGAADDASSGPAAVLSPYTDGPSVAVLPFVDMSPEGDQEYFSDGISEELLNSLARIPGLRVPARTSSFRFKGQPLAVGDIARQLGVEAIVEGSVRRSGERVRITVQLVDARADRHLWSETFDRDLEDVFAVQSEIARTVAEALRVTLLPGPAVRATRPTSPAAHDLYLRGLFHWNRRSAADLALAVRFFQEAVALDPDYARAYAGLALTWAVTPIGFTPSVPPEEAWLRVEEAAARALDLDPSLAEAHAALGLSYHYRWRWDDAEREYLRALELEPGYATAHQWYGEHLGKTGRAEEGVRSMRRALALDPLSLVLHNDLGLALLLARRTPEAVEQFQRTLTLDPGFAIPLYFLHRIHLMEGRTAEAEEAGRRWAELTGAVPPDEVVTIVRAVRDPGERVGAGRILRRWEADPSPRWIDIAFYWTALGDQEAALHALERARDARLPMLLQAATNPGFDPLRGHPRMERLVRGLGLPAGAPSSS